MLDLKKIISSIADAGQKLFKKSNIKKNDLESLISLCDDLLSNKGIVFGITVARDITNLYKDLSYENKLNFFKEINKRYKPDHKKVNEAIKVFTKNCETSMDCKVTENKGTLVTQLTKSILKKAAVYEKEYRAKNKKKYEYTKGGDRPKKKK